MNRNVYTLITLISFVLFSVPAWAAEESKMDPMAQLDSADPAIQIAGCRAVGASKTEAATERLLSLLNTASNQDVAACAAASLGAIGKKENMLDALIVQAGKTDSTRVKYASLLAMAILRDDKSAEQIDAIIGNTADSSTDELLKDLATKLQQRFTK